MTDLVKRFRMNHLGRDLVIGDLHGCMGQLHRALADADFDPARDRLFSVGDLVDRGEDSHGASELLEKPWFHAVRGNHEQMWIDTYSDGDPTPRSLDVCCGRNDRDWWLHLSVFQRQSLLDRYRMMPIVIEIETVRGLVGLVHAEVSLGVTWPAFVASLSESSGRNAVAAIWARRRFQNGDCFGVKGIDRVFVGHNITPLPLMRGNVFYIDTGAMIASPSDEGFGPFGLTMVNVCAAGVDIRDRPHSPAARRSVDAPFSADEADAGEPDLDLGADAYDDSPFDDAEFSI